MSNIPVIKFLFLEDWGVLNEALTLNPIYETEEFTNANDVATFMSSIEGALVVTSIRNKNDLIQLANLVKSSKKVATNTAFKIVVVNFSHDKQFEKAIAKLGILDIVDDKVNTKALRFKIDFWMKSINAQVKKNVKQDSALGVKNLEANKSQDKKNSDYAPVWLEAIDCEDDIWILKSDSDCKKILSRWLVKLQGPSPYVGKWLEVEGQEKLWRFDLRSEQKDFFILNGGEWFFSGDQKPEFIWKENLWLVTGDSFELFCKQDKNVFTRLKFKEKSFSIARNSDYAKTKEKMIVETFNKEIVFQKEQISAGKDSVEHETSRYTNLSGEGKTDHLNVDPLSGKGKTEHSQHNPLEGNFNPNDLLSSDPLAAGTTKHSSGDLLDLEIQLDHKKHYHAHNPTDTYEGGDLNGSSSTDKLRAHYNYHKKDKSLDHKEKDFFDSSLSNKKNNEKSQEENTQHLDFEIDLKGRIGQSKEASPNGQVLPLRSHQKSNSVMNSFDEEEDFEKISQTAVVTSYLHQNEKRYECKLDDFYDQTIIFHTSHAGILAEEKIAMDLSFNYMSQDTKLNFDGLVSSIDEDGEGLEYITVEISKKNVLAFESFMKLYNARQTNVTSFMKRAKGL